MNIRRAQWMLLSVLTLGSIFIGATGVYALQSAPTLFTEGDIVTVREGIKITKIDELELVDTDLWKLPAFKPLKAREKEARWWQAQRQLYHMVAARDSVIISFRDENAPPEDLWELVAQVGHMSAGNIITRIGLIYAVAVIFIFTSISVFRRHPTTTGFLCAFFLSSSALYLTSIASVVHRPILMDPDILRFLVDMFFVASTGQISIVHFSLVFPEKKHILSRHPSLASALYVYSAAISILYLSDMIALTTTLPFLVLWIALMLGSFVHSITHLDDEFMKKQVRITFLAPILVVTFFVVSIVLQWPEGESPVNNYALFSLILPFALILSLDNQKLYHDRLAVERHSRVEKERIHRELHDTVLNDLASISIVTEGAERFGSEPDKFRARIERIKEYASESSRRLRNFLWVIDDKQDTWEDVANSLRRLGYDLLTRADILFELDAHGIHQDIRSPTPALKHTIHQIFREALINITKHAHATKVQSSLTFGSSCAVIVISDNGVGMDPDSVDAECHGLENMRRRVSEQGGELVIDSKTGGGTKIIAQLPIN